jgi:energy-coupling factor transporter ATP-binding protein EcfA2
MTSIVRKNLAGDYALTLSWRYAEVEFLGLPKLKDSRVFRLEHIYVPLRLCRDWADRFDKQKTIYVPKALREHRHLAVLGDPGCGKSTLVKVLTYAFGEADSNAYKRACGELIPIPIILRDYKTRQWQSYENMLRDFIATLDEDIRSEVTPEWLLEHLREGKAILLIDGLDEVGNREERLRLRDEIIFPLLNESRRSYTLLTSRIVGYEEVPFDFMLVPMEEGKDKIASATMQPFEPLLNRLYVAPFDDEEIAQFITRWWQLRESFPDKQREGVESLMRALNQNDRVKRLAHNPQLLTLIALIHRVTANLPSGRVELYDKIVEAYLETIQVYRKLGTPAKLDEMKRWLAKVGWEMQVRRDEEINKSQGKQADDLLVSREEIRQWLIEAIAKERGQAEAPELADHFLDYVARRSGLLVPRGPEEFSFAHLTFQEYFAAFELRGRVRQFDRLAETCAEVVARRHWHETLNVLFEMLTEFHGACDDLFDLMAKQANDQGSAAEFFSALLLDEQSGLSPAKQQQAAQLALARACDRFNNSIIKNLRQLATSQFAQWVAQPLTQQGRTAQPEALGRDFFLAGGELLEEEGLQFVRQTIRERGHLGWSVDQIEDMTLIGSGAKEIVAWAGNHLPLNYWLRPLFSWWSNQSFSLVELNLTPTLNAHTLSPRHLMLAQAGLTIATSTSQIIRAILLARAQAQALDRAQARALALARARALDGDRALALVRALDRALARAQAQALDRAQARALALARAQALDLAWAQALNLAQARALSAAISSSRLEQAEQDGDALIALGVDAEWLAFQPDRDQERAATIARLREFLSADDDWTRLQAINYLITLSAGTPELCAERNRLLDRALEETDKFTFPDTLREVTQSQDFIAKEFPEAIRIIFLHEPGDPLLKPEWFDPRSEESRFFLSPPREFFALAAEVLDPNGETELAKWREP